MSKYEDAKENNNEDPEPPLERDPNEKPKEQASVRAKKKHRKHRDKDRHRGEGGDKDRERDKDKSKVSSLKSKVTEKSKHGSVKHKVDVFADGAVFNDAELFGDDVLHKDPTQREVKGSKESQKELPKSSKEVQKSCKELPAPPAPPMSKEKDAAPPIEMRTMKETRTVKEKELRTVKEGREHKKKKRKQQEESSGRKDEFNSGRPQHDSDRDKKKDSKKERRDSNKEKRDSGSTRQRREKKEPVKTPKDESKEKEGEMPISRLFKKFKNTMSPEPDKQSPVDIQTAREKKPKKKSAEKADVAPSPKTTREKKETLTQREKRKARKKEKIEQYEKRMNYVMLETPEQMKEAEAKPTICNEMFGYGSNFPNWLLEPLRTFPHIVPKGKRIRCPMVFKTMVVYDVPPEFAEFVDVGDIMHKVDGEVMKNQRHYIATVANKLITNDEEQTVTFSIYKPIRTRKIPDNLVSKLVPDGFEILPQDFDYVYCYFPLMGKCKLGMSIKSYNNKVYVCGVDNGPLSLARRCILVGDSLLQMNEVTITSVEGTFEKFRSALLDFRKKYLRLLIERGRTGHALKTAKLALMVEKKFEMNPKLADDVLELCKNEVERMRNDNKGPPKPIYKWKPQKRAKGQLDFNKESSESPIGADVNNIQLLLPTPEVPNAYEGQPACMYHGPGSTSSSAPVTSASAEDPRNTPVSKPC